MSFDDMDVPTVSPMIGEGADAHRLVRVGGYAFTAWANDDEPRMRDVELAEKLGYGQPRDIRKLISRLAKEGNCRMSTCAPRWRARRCRLVAFERRRSTSTG